MTGCRECLVGDLENLKGDGRMSRGNSRTTSVVEETVDRSGPRKGH